MEDFEELKKQTSVYIKEKLQEIGFKKQAKSNTFIKKINDECYGWIGIPDVRRPGEKLVKISCVIGLVNKKVEEFIHYYKGKGWSLKPLVPTISEPLGYLTPKNTYMRWEIKKARHIKKKVNDLIDYIIKYGLPWLGKMANRDELLNALKAGEGIPGYFIYRIPALLILMGKKDEALSYAKSFYHQLENSNKTVFEEYKNFYYAIETIAMENKK